MASSKRPREDAQGAAEQPVASSSKKIASLLQLEREPLDTTQIATWNMKSLDSTKELAKGQPFRQYIETEDAHIVVLTETHQTPSKTPFEQDPYFDFLKTRYRYRCWRGKIAILSKYQPINVTYGFPNGTRYDAAEGAERLITLEFPNTFILGSYVQNSGDKFGHLHLRTAWNEDFAPYIRSLDARKPVIWVGDFNVVREDKISGGRSDDLERSPIAWGNHGGTHLEEREAHEALLERGPDLMNPRRPAPKFVDVWRLIHPQAREYTHQTGHSGKWRLDGYIVSERLLWRVRKCEIRHEVNEKLFEPGKNGPQNITPASDHWPCWLSLEMEEIEM